MKSTLYVNVGQNAVAEIVGQVKVTTTTVDNNKPSYSINTSRFDTNVTNEGIVSEVNYDVVVVWLINSMSVTVTGGEAG